MKALTSIIEEIKKLSGVDGLVIFDEDLKILESSLPAQFINDNTGFALRNIINNNIKTLEDCENTILMTEQGAWYISKTAQNYLMLLGGNKEPVDIPDFIKLGDKIKKEMLRC